MAVDDEEGCYFRRQPETEAEFDAAISALHMSCIEAARYGGTNLRVRRRLALLGSPHLCDHPFPDPVFIRDRVRFCIDNISDATQVARLVVSWFERFRQRGSCTTKVSGNRQQATFGFTVDAEYGIPRSYTITRIDLAPTPAPASNETIYRDTANRLAWLLAEERNDTTSPRYPPRWIHEVLIENGAAMLRWFSREELAAGHSGYDQIDD
jgi:hypothetical protein